MICSCCCARHGLAVAGPDQDGAALGVRAGVLRRYAIECAVYFDGFDMRDLHQLLERLTSDCTAGGGGARTGLGRGLDLAAPADGDAVQHDLRQTLWAGEIDLVTHVDTLRLD